MTGFLLGLGFGAGVAFVWAGAVCGFDVRFGRGGLSGRLRKADLPVSPPLFMLAVVASGGLAAVLAWSLIDVPVLAIAGAIAGGYAPVAWVGARQDRRLRERERAWPAALSQLADALGPVLLARRQLPLGQLVVEAIAEDLDQRVDGNLRRHDGRQQCPR